MDSMLLMITKASATKGISCSALFSEAEQNL